MEINLIDLYQAVVKNIRRHLIIGFSVSVIGLIILFILPDIYKSSVNLFPNKKYFSGSAGLLGSLGTSLSDKASSLLGGGSAETDKILVILNSESAKRHIIEKHNLMEHYEMIDRDFPYTRTRKELESNTEFNVFPEGNILIDVYDEDRQMAYDMANSYIVYLDSALKAIDSNEARQNREFLEKRLRKNEAEIDSIQTAFQRFQRETGIYELEEQLIANFTVVGETIRSTMESEFGVLLQKNLAKPTSQVYTDLNDRLGKNTHH
jgi:capsular polysaccharide biosynthesis protein